MGEYVSIMERESDLCESQPLPVAIFLSLSFLTCKMKLLWALNEIMCVKFLEQCIEVQIIVNSPTPCHVEKENKIKTESVQLIKLELWDLN